MTHEEFVKSIYPTAEVYFGGAVRGLQSNSQEYFRIYQGDIRNDYDYFTEIGYGFTAKWAWYVAYRHIQRKMIEVLEE